MNDIEFHRPAWVGDVGLSSARALLDHEWLVTNGCGGYASSTVGAIMTRKYHGYLVAALTAPWGRMVMLQDLRTTVQLGDGPERPLSGAERSNGEVSMPGDRHLRDFRLELGLPVWEYEVDGVILGKRIVMPYQQNTVCVSWSRLDAGATPCTLRLRPFVHVRSYEADVTTPRGPYAMSVEGTRLELRADPHMAAVTMDVEGDQAAFERDEVRLGEVAYRVERDRGYEWVGEDWSPGVYSLALPAGGAVSFVATAEREEVGATVRASDAFERERRRRRALLARSPLALDDPTVAQLTLAADQFVITPAGRQADAALLHAEGDEARTVIAGYHWFTDWGRDTMISLEGLTLCTGRAREAGAILRTFAHYVRDGLIPNMFPNGASEGLYHTADASLWFFHAVHRYLRATHDAATREQVLPVLDDIVRHHVAGTRFGIHVDPADDLLSQGAPGYQLTWMDAKVDGWVVTPRRGKAVEINALWYNALCVLQALHTDAGATERAAELAARAGRVRASFNRRFWNPDTGCLFDVVDGEHGGDDPACRPNQLFAISLDYPVLDEPRWRAVLDVARERLLTPVGLRSLAPGHPDYKSRYFGDLRARDAAYHQGTVWAWLIGPWVDAWLRVHPTDLAGARASLQGLVRHLDDFGVGSIAEVFDAEPPFTPRGCIAQAWSVAETLRCWRRTAPARADGALSA